MLLINEDDNYPLPMEFHFTHNLCAILYDQLADVIANEKFKSLGATSFGIQPGNEGLVSELMDGKIHVLDWLAKFSCNETLCNVLTKHIALAILSDYLNFVYESLNCARKGKMSVAYALLRKPFTDELLILEQLLANRENFVDRFFHQSDQKTYDPYKATNQLSIIETAIQEFSFWHPFSSQLIYQLRYDKSCNAGVNGISNQAIHIVTSHPNYRTADQNFNFVFSGPSEYESYCSHYYFFAPLLLLYTATVVDEIIFTFLPEEEHCIEKTLRAFRRLIAVEFLYSDSIDEEKEEAVSLLNMFTLTCDSCGHTNDLVRADYELFLKTNIFICSKCFAQKELNTMEDIEGIMKLLQLMK